MIITVIVRVKNEEKNLRRFVECYHDWVDHILVQDDDSEDQSYLYEIEQEFPKVKVNYIPVTQFTVGDTTRGYQATQLNLLIFAAECLGSDWIIMDDCDCFPNDAFIKDLRGLLEDCSGDVVGAVRLYLYKDQGHFPELSKANDKWMSSLYAWRANEGFYFILRDKKPQKFSEKIDAEFLPPYVLLHCPWPDDETVKKKRDYYLNLYGEEYKDFDPKKFGGKLEKLPEWV